MIILFLISIVLIIILPMIIKWLRKTQKKVELKERKNTEYKNKLLGTIQDINRKIPNPTEDHSDLIKDLDKLEEQLRLRREIDEITR